MYKTKRTERKTVLMHLKNEILLNTPLTVVLHRFMSALTYEKLATENTRIGCTCLSKYKIKFELDIKE